MKLKKRKTEKDKDTRKKKISKRGKRKRKKTKRVRRIYILSCLRYSPSLSISDLAQLYFSGLEDEVLHEFIRPITQQGRREGRGENGEEGGMGKRERERGWRGIGRTRQRWAQ